MSVDTYVRDKVALALVTLYRVQGKTGTYSNRSAAPVTLYMDIKDESVELATELGFNTEHSARKLFVPRQTNFPPTAGVNIGDEITVESKAYSVERVEQAGSDSPQFELSCVRNVAVNGGVK